MKLQVVAAAGVCVLFLGSTRLPAATFTDYFNISGSGVTGSGTLTLQTTANPAVDEIVGISGDLSATASPFSGMITGLVPASYDSTSPTGDVNGVFDNLFYPGAAASSCFGGSATAILDYCGLEFRVGTEEVNIFASGSGSALDISYGKSGVGNDQQYLPVTLTVSATPEPSSLFLVGTGALGFVGALRRRWLAGI